MCDVNLKWLVEMVVLGLRCYSVLRKVLVSWLKLVFWVNDSEGSRVVVVRVRLNWWWLSGILGLEKWLVVIVV